MKPLFFVNSVPGGQNRQHFVEVAPNEDPQQTAYRLNRWPAPQGTRSDAAVIQWINERLARDPQDVPTVLQVAIYGRYAYLEHARARLEAWGRAGRLVGWPWRGGRS